MAIPGSWWFTHYFKLRYFLLPGQLRGQVGPAGKHLACVQRKRDVKTMPCGDLYSLEIEALCLVIAKISALCPLTAFCFLVTDLEGQPWLRKAP